MTAPRPVTPPGTWRRALREHRPPAFDATAHRHVVVISAHPDDETLGAGEVLRSIHRSGATVTLVVATDGEAAYPGLDAAARHALAATRRTELDAALAAQGLAGVTVHRLGLPDSALADHHDTLVEVLAPLLVTADAYLAPWPGDPHPDHRAAGLATAAAAPVTAHGWSYPVWAWAWLEPTDVPWDRARIVPLDDAARTVRRAAVACFASQVGPGPDGSPPVLEAGLLDHLDRDVDLLFREPRAASAPVARFDELYADGRDPWRTDSWYERRKRSVVLAVLPRERYRAAFEPGCGTGELTVELARRCDRVRASDPVPAAVARAGDAGAGLAGVSVEVGALPAVVPAAGAGFDLAVFSEVLYYLDDAAVSATLQGTLRALEPGGDLVAVHWRGWPAEAPRTAAATHRMLCERPELDLVVEHTDEQFVLIVLRRR